ncbi:hypothetical protein LSTR_LSTR013713 [Laodelphax striatellus]|uniref:EF-hand domain-containing protein n=1 Tax=Laodelphax striatellus TaxID=195883 RepID=A0A482WPY7_LAOST|nr:hypothetical protein LSTR_LSTR013713 [Laodelphax striatellus]
MTTASVVNETIFKAFMNLFDKCDVENANFVRKSELVKIISSSVGNQNPNIEDLIVSIIGCHDNNQYMTKNEFITKIKKYMNSNQECVEHCEKPVTTDYYYDSPLNCSNTSNSSCNELKRLELICDDLTVQVQNAEEQNTKLRNENYLISSSYEKLSTREKELQQPFEELQTDLAKKDNRCTLLQRRVADAGKALEKEKEKCRELPDSLKRKSDDLAAAMAKLKTVQKESEDRKREMVELERKDLEMKNRMLEDSAGLNIGDQICDSTLSEIEGECFDNNFSLEEYVDESELEMLYKINDQQKTIDSLTELIEKERLNNKMSSEAFERLKKDLCDCRKTIDFLKKEKQKVEEEWRIDKVRLEQITNQTKTEDKKPANNQSLQHLTVAKRDPAIRYNIERQQMTIRKLVEKISEKSIPSTAVMPQESLTVEKFGDFDSKSSVEDSGENNTQEKYSEIGKTEICLRSKEAEITDLADPSKALVVMSSSNDEMDNVENPKIASRNQSTNHRNKNTRRLGCYSDCLLHPVLLFAAALLTLTWLLYRALRESAISCLTTPPSSHHHQSGLVGQLICPYVNFKWNEPPLI